MADAPLPGVLAEVEEVAGREAAIALSLSFGGDWLHIPKPGYLAQHPDHSLVTALGDEAAAAVAARMAGNSVRIPVARRACACHLSAQGMTVAAIAARLHTGRDTVRKYIRDA